MKRAAMFLATLAAAALLPAAGAAAAGETARADISMSPLGKTLYREAPMPVRWRIEAEITPGTGVVLPIKRIKAYFPVEMTFNPNPKMPACPDSKVGPPPIQLSVPPEVVIARCPSSVIGNGYSTLYLAKLPGSILEDGVLVMFHGGRNRDGSPRIKVYGYSQAVTTGLYFEGRMVRNVLTVDIPQITFDSAVGEFDLNIPGDTLINPADQVPVPGSKGRDPGYVRATCPASGSWTGYAIFTLGERDGAGRPTGPSSTVTSPRVNPSCVGARGRARLATPVVRGPSRLTGRATYRVTLRNKGTASARSVKVTARGRGISGSAVVGRIRPGRSVTVRVKVAGPAGRSARVRFAVAFR